MKEQFRQYILELYKDVPLSVYEGLVSIILLGAVILIVVCGIKKGLRYSAGLLLVEYVFLLFCSTVFFRAYSETRGHNFIPFWSYERQDLLIENIMNVVVFVPVGIILGFMVNDLRSQNGSWLKAKGSWLIALLMGMGISISIETMQYFFHRGFAEVDDVMHNTVGCILGYILVQGSRLMVHGFQKLRNQL